MTFCKFSNKFKDIKNIKNLNIDYIFVDEISMVHEIYYKFLLIIKQILSKFKFIICGDFKQLPRYVIELNIAIIRIAIFYMSYQTITD